jgi:spore coat protein A, manganese oxidase
MGPRRTIVVAATALALLAPALARLDGQDAKAFIGMIIAGPAAQTVGYATPIVYSPEGATVAFNGADPLNTHNVVSRAVDSAGEPLFQSEFDTLYLPDPVDVTGTESLSAGSYAFYCSLHPNMTGTLVVGSPSDEASGPPPGPFLVPMPVPEERTGSDITIHIAQASVPALPGPQTPMYTYDGTFPGPTIRRPAGEATRVTFVNDLPPTAGEATVHRHGGHNSSSDDGQPNRGLIAPGASRTYTYELTEGGTPERAAFEWYHDHRLNRTGENLWRGLAGMFIVDDDVDTALPLPEGEFDVPILLAERTFDEDNELIDPFVGRTPPGDEVAGEKVLANGRYQPFFDVADRKYRFRLLNASNFSLYELRLSNGTPLTQIGTESGLLPAPVTRSSILLGPAERAEVVVDFAGLLGEQVVLESVPRTDGGGPLGVGAGSRSADILQFRVTRDVHDDSSVPNQLRPLPALDTPAVPLPDRVWIAGLGFDPERSGTAWTLNGKPYRDHIVEARPTVGTTETWLLTNPTPVSHVIHIHGTDFLTLSRNGRAPPPWEAGLKDTFLLDPGDSLVVAGRFTDHLGTFVVHCHMLEHEDHGMMGQYEVVDGGPPAPLPAPQSSSTAPGSFYCAVVGARVPPHALSTRRM